MTEPTEKTDEKLPISEFYKVVDYTTIFKKRQMMGARAMRLMENAQ